MLILACDSSVGTGNPPATTLGDAIAGYVRTVLDRRDAWHAALAARVREIEQTTDLQVIDGGLGGSRLDAHWAITHWRTGEPLAAGGGRPGDLAIRQLDRALASINARHIRDVERELRAARPELIADPEPGHLPASLAAVLWRWALEQASHADLAAVTGWTREQVAARRVDAKSR